ncbi:class A beta-lactamase [Novosphingobium sp. KCTC 2891]|uniref:class A beta-lactamase n=1 Tax=Novosphingobium sp. KCTC 2891 TaxID=2989730 RepID=UPI002221C809|nr:class A beta-lactamase [Novosphingobium sp. KCTC 2891]MCW1383846.1 class A beta-lactamase [Novosphingobium sp. KCTC 2891]
MHRRQFALGLAGFVAASAAQIGAAGPAFARSERKPAPHKPFAGVKALGKLEHGVGGRLGVSVLDTGTGQSFGWREDELFGMCSTFKLSLAALVLREVDAGRLDANERLMWSVLDLLPNSPVTGAAIGPQGMTVTALAQAAQATSDNLAANLVMRRLGGPGALTAFWRSLGDTVSRLDRYETALNMVPAGEQRDTTSARAITRSAAQFLAGPVLSAPSRDMLLRWMAGTTTGTRRIRAGLPAGWGAGDKTGTGMAPGMESKINDIAVVFPPGRAPLVVTCFYEPADAPQTIRPQDEAVHAAVGRIIADPAAWKQR